MTLRKTLPSFVLIIILFGFAAGWNPVRAQSYSQLEFDAERVPWNHLFYQAKNFMVDVTVDMRLEFLSADKVETALIESRQGTALHIPGKGAFKLTADIIIDSILQPPVKVINQVWFDPGDGTALGRVRLRRGEDDQKKLYRFTQQGVFRHRMEPKDQHEAREAPETWTDVRDTFYSYNLDELGCVNVSERLLLTYIVSAVERWEENQPLFLCIFGKRQLFQVQLKSAGLHEVEIDFIEKKQQGEQQRQGEVKAHKILLVSRPLEADLEAVENFSFLGFQRDIVFFVHPESRLPVQISGVIPKAGRVTVKLQEVQLKD
jgi:hypothetical protein